MTELQRRALVAFNSWYEQAPFEVDPDEEVIAERIRELIADYWYT